MIRYLITISIISLFIILAFMFPVKAQETCVNYSEANIAFTEKIGRFEKISIDRTMYLDYLQYVYLPDLEDYIENAKKTTFERYELWVVRGIIVVLVPVKSDCMPKVIMIRYNIHEEILKLLGKPT